MLSMLRRWALLWAGACVVALVVLVPRAAWAQTCPNVAISVIQPVNRYGAGGPDIPANQYPLRPDNLDPTAINYSDCAADIHLQFNLNVQGLPCSDTMQVWVGTTDCTQLSARQTTSGSPRCWPVKTSVLLSQTLEVDIRAQDIVGFISNAEPPVTYQPQGIAACHSQDEPGVVALNIAFMAMEADGQTVDGTTTPYTLNAALVGPSPPTSVTAGVGENLIVANWTPATDTTIQGYNIYCEGQGSSGSDAALTDGEVLEATLVCPDTGVEALNDGATEAGAIPDTDGGACVPVTVGGTPGAGGASCVSTNLVDSFCLVNGVSVPLDSCVSAASTLVDAGDAAIFTPVFDSGIDASVPAGTAVGISNISSMYLCGQVGGNTTSSLVIQGFSNTGAGIQDGTEYAVGVAAFDGEGNTGLISNLSCVIPAPVITFWDRYVMDGGLAGGGFCALEGPGVPVGTSLFGIGIGAAALTYIRRRRRSR
jgi:hypothetical protein